MSSLPHQFGSDHMHRFRRVHFVGIGGVGMCGIAEVMHNLGYTVSGSDLSASDSVRRLKSLGVDVMERHHADNVNGMHVVIASTAIPDDNPELVAAREQRIPIVSRAEMLGELMRFRHGIAVAGTHGKTTTTSLIATILDAASLDPTFVIGGMLNALSSNARLGKGSYLVAEADESDASFLLLQPTISVVTNVDQDHMTTYAGDFSRLQDAFIQFLHNLPFYGIAVICNDDPVAADLGEALPRTVITYGIDTEADIRAFDIEQKAGITDFKVTLPNTEAPLQISLNMPGQHNVLNALAAIAVAWELRIEPSLIQKALSEFSGVGRRFNVHGEIAWSDGSALFIDDYGHHPTEIEATLQAARAGWPGRRMVVVFQPHRYSRTHELMDDFARVLSEADVLILSEVYAAGEEPRTDADGRALARALRARKQVDPVFVEHPRDAAELFDDLIEDGDLVMLLGAGDIGAVASEFYAQGAQLFTGKNAS